MPRYFYECGECGGQFKAVHGMTEKLEDCKLCDTKSSLTRIPQLTSTLNPVSKEAGRVKEAIEENREILKEMNKEARNQVYDD